MVYVSFSVGTDKSGLFPGRIVDAQEVVPGEIWKILVCSLDRVNTVYILAGTGEPLGRTEYHHDQRQSPSGLQLRADWSALIASYLEQDSLSEAPKLLERIAWKNHEEYEHGVSRLWLRRVDKEGEVGAYKKVVARRYALACVVGNRFGLSSPCFKPS